MASCYESKELTGDVPAAGRQINRYGESPGRQTTSVLTGTRDNVLLSGSRFQKRRKTDYLRRTESSYLPRLHSFEIIFVDC